MILSLGLLAAPARGFSPEAESVLERLREGIASGSASEGAYNAFLDRLAFGAAGDGGDCRSWAALPEARSEDLRFAGLREALAEVCPSEPAAPEDGPGGGDAVGARGGAPGGVPEGAPKNAPKGGKASAQGKDARALISVSHSARPRRDPTPTGWDRLAGEGAFAGGAWRLAFTEGARADQRLLRLGSGRFALFAGQFHASLERTRLPFVAGSRFYAGRSGTSGVAGPWESRSSALDGLALSIGAGRWIAEAAGAWNRLGPRAGETGPGPDALLYQVGLALPARVPPRASPRRGKNGDGGTNGENRAGWDLRLQFMHLRGESAFSDGSDGSDRSDPSDPADLTVAGCGLQAAWDGFARWSLGLAGSRFAAPPGMQSRSGFGEAGGYVEAALASPVPSGTVAESGQDAPGGPASWRLEGRQATEAWANPLQSPRGILRDTAGGWNLPGRGEGAAAARGCFPFAARGAWAMSLRSGLEADWSSAGGLLAQSGRLGLLQKWGAWTGETGTALQWRRSGTASAAEGAALAGDAALPDDPGGRAALSAMGWGQNLAWRQGVWKAKASFTWKGEGYAGALPAPLSLEAGRSADPRRNEGAWSVAALTGDIRNPGGYLRADVRQSWRLGRRLKAEQAIRLPWTPEGLGAGLSYQLRLEAAL
jgi:hypothetical protein